MNSKRGYINPLAFQRSVWPDVTLFAKQREMLYSADENDITYVPSCNMAGKDFMMGLIPLIKFLRALKAGKTCRIVLTSVNDAHLDVVWGEIGRFLTTAKYPLLSTKGGPLRANSKEIRLEKEWDAKNPLSYLKGMVAGDDMDALAGHHAEVTMAGGDESSGLHNLVLNKFQGWARNMVFIANPNPTQNFFYKAVRAGDVPRDSGEGFHSKIIRICAEDTPNVQFALAQKEAGVEPTGEVILKGVLTWSDYVTRRKTWDEERQCVGLDAKFYEGAQVMMFPRSWLDRAEKMAELLDLRKEKRGPCSLGVDPAEGGDKTSLAVVDDRGLVEMENARTPDTSTIKASVVYMMQKWDIPPERVCIDRGGGGKQIADELRAAGHDVMTVSFGESVLRDPQRGTVQVEEKIEDKERRYTYKNRRAQMYTALRLLLDPYEGLAVEPEPEVDLQEIPGHEGEGLFETVVNHKVSTRKTFAIPRRFRELRDELEPIPFTRVLGGQGEGLIYLIPKDKPNPTYRGPTMKELIGHSPDLADATVLAVYAMQQEEEFTAGVF